MTKCIIFTNANGGCSVVNPAKNSTLTMEEHAAKAVPAGVAHTIVDAADIPSDRTFRNAWKVSGKAVVTDMPKAIVLAQDKVRAARDPVLRKLDVESVRRLEGEPGPPVTARKDTARNAPADPRITSANDHDALKAAMEACINEVEALA